MDVDHLKPAAVLFDLDGTLADSFEGIRHALNAALREEGLSEYDLGWVHAHVGRGAPALVRDAVGGEADDALVRAVGGRFGAHYRASFLDLTPALPGAREVLAYVAWRTGGKVAVVSNKYEDLSRAWLRHVGLEEHVAVVVGPDTYGVRMPGKSMARRVSFLIGRDGRIVHVTDSPSADVHLTEMKAAVEKLKTL